MSRLDFYQEKKKRHFVDLKSSHMLAFMQMVTTFTDPIGFLSL